MSLERIAAGPGESNAEPKAAGYVTAPQHHISRQRLDQACGRAARRDRGHCAAHTGDDVFFAGEMGRRCQGYHTVEDAPQCDETEEAQARAGDERQPRRLEYQAALRAVEGKESPAGLDHDSVHQARASPAS